MLPECLAVSEICISTQLALLAGSTVTSTGKWIPVDSGGHTVNDGLRTYEFAVRPIQN